MSTSLPGIDAPFGLLTKRRPSACYRHGLANLASFFEVVIFSVNLLLLLYILFFILKNNIIYNII